MSGGERVVRVRAPNPGPMTLEGTNTYLLDGGNGTAIVIDPGPAIAAHVAAILRAATARGLDVAAIAVTHGHPDHAPGAALLAERTGAPIYAHAEATFAHDGTLADGASLRVGDLDLVAVDAPGHARDHLVFWLARERALFTGDVVIGRGTVVIAPPGGDMRAYQRTLGSLQARFDGARALFGGHGDAVAEPAAKLDEYIAHRRRREAEVLAELNAGAKTIPELVRAIYRDVDRRLWPAAARQIDAYLIALANEGRVHARRPSRVPTDDDRAMLRLDLAALADDHERDVAAAELGTNREEALLACYELST